MIVNIVKIIGITIGIQNGAMGNDSGHDGIYWSQIGRARMNELDTRGAPEPFLCSDHRIGPPGFKLIKKRIFLMTPKHRSEVDWDVHIVMGNELPLHTTNQRIISQRVRHW